MSKPEGMSVTLTFGQAAKGSRDLIDTAMSGKRDRREAGYRPAEQPDERCRLCAHYQGDDQSTEAPCELVGGDVEADAVCDLFEPAQHDEDEGEEANEAESPPFGEGEPDEHE